MTERKVYVIEGRRKATANLWRTRCALTSARDAAHTLAEYRQFNARFVFRIVVYKPTESTDR